MFSPEAGRAERQRSLRTMFVRGYRRSMREAAWELKANPADIDAAKQIGADIVELHTGRYCHDVAGREVELNRIQVAARHSASLGIETHAGHGLGFDTVGPIAAIAEIEELNIGHFLIGESVFCGLEAAILKMRQLMDAARNGDRHRKNA